MNEGAFPYLLSSCSTGYGMCTMLSCMYACADTLPDAFFQPYKNAASTTFAGVGRQRFDGGRDQGLHGCRAYRGGQARPPNDRLHHREVRRREVRQIPAAVCLHYLLNGRLSLSRGFCLAPHGACCSPLYLSFRRCLLLFLRSCDRPRSSANRPGHTTLGKKLQGITLSQSQTPFVRRRWKRDGQFHPLGGQSFT